MPSVLELDELLSEVDSPSQIRRASAEPELDRKPIVLVASPSRSTRSAIAVALTSVGYDVVSAADALSAAESLQRLGEVGLVFVDRRLPGTDGLQFCRTIRLCHGPHLPIVLLSRTVGWWLSHGARSAGAFAVLRKPIDPCELIRVTAERLPVRS